MVAVTHPVRMTFDFGLHGPTSIEDHAEFNLWSNLDDTEPVPDWDAALTALAETCYTAWATNADAAIFRTSVTLESVKAAELDTSLHTVREQVHNPGTKWAGTGTAASLPWQCAFCVGLYSYTPGSFIPNARNRRGRIYLPPMTSSALDIPTKGTFSDSRVADTLAWVGAMLHDIGTSTVAGTSLAWSLGVLSKVVNKAAIHPPNIWGLTDVAADQVIDTQRRRTHQETKNRQSAGVTA